MRSSVTESHPSQGYEVRSSNYAPPLQRPGDARPQSYIPNYQRRPPNSIPQSWSQRPKQRLTLTPAEGWLAMALLAVAVYSLVLSIISINQVKYSFILLWSTAIGLLVGLLVAKIPHLPQAMVHLAACLLGYWLSVFLTSALAFHSSWLVLLGSLRTVLANGFANALTPESDMVFLFYLSFLSFFLGYFGAWLTYRAHLPWLVALVYCSILLINLAYANQGQDQSLLVIVLLTSLVLLIARVQLARQLAGWTSEGLYTDRRWLQSITSRFMRIATALAAIALLVSLVLPALNQPAAGVHLWDNLNNLWTNITHGQISLQNPGALLQPYQPSANFFGDQLPITGSVDLPTGEVLTYTSNAAPQYLEGFTYDYFDGHTWTSTVPGQGRNYPAGASIPPDLQGDFDQATTNVTIEQPPDGSQNYIFAPYEPISFNVDTTLYGTPFTTAWTQTNALTQGEQYQVNSLIPAATAQDLSLVPLPNGKQYIWLNDRNYSILQQYYLQIPADLSPTVRDTALEWTQGADNAYTAVEMLQNHLNDATQFVYSVSNPPIPANVDAVSWLLKTHQGFCTYYATAMTIMARILGIPARVVSGFSQGHFDAQRKVWAVDGSDAHSWVQVYFPDYGWFSFDPTPGYAANSPAQPQPAPPPVSTQPPARSTPTRSTGSGNPSHPTTPGSGSGANGTPLNAAARRNLLLDLSLALFFCLLLALSVGIFRYWRRKPSASLSFVSLIYWRVCRLATWAGFAPQKWQTPYEYSRALVRHFPQAAAPLRRLTNLYVRERWAAPRDMPYPAEKDDLARHWPHLRRTLVRLLFLRFRICNNRRPYSY